MDGHQVPGICGKPWALNKILSWFLNWLPITNPWIELQLVVDVSKLFLFQVTFLQHPKVGVTVWVTRFSCRPRREAEQRLGSFLETFAHLRIAFYLILALGWMNYPVIWRLWDSLYRNPCNYKPAERNSEGIWTNTIIPTEPGRISSTSLVLLSSLLAVSHFTHFKL